ncbi:MAG: ABC transporter permease [Candidatus Calescibacterium sp.]|nr:ABC transporter permease [Candidatus Calescibacterium sp.]MCX7971958.1 ABC transporter permease [bacterium]MDW8195456.1 ABC transporter permease [Candidatus Calescibacterium sp.]
MDFRKVNLIVSKDILEYLSTVFPFISMFIALLFISIFFISAVYSFFQVAFIALSFPSFAKNFNVNDMIVTPYFGFVAFFSILIIPIIAAKSFAQEKKLKTIELLFTYPFKEIELVFGKVLSSFLVYFVFLIFAMLYIVIFVVIYSLINKGPIDFGVIFSGFLGLVLLGFAVVSVSVCISTFVDDIIPAWAISLVVILIFWLIGFTGDFANVTYKTIVKNISLANNFENFSKGVIDVKNIVYFITFSILFIYLAVMFLTDKE